MIAVIVYYSVLACSFDENKTNKKTEYIVLTIC